MNVNELLDTIEDALEEGANVPLSGGKKIVDVEQIRDYLDEIRANLPGELRQAQQIVNDRAQIVETANAQAQAIVKKAEERARILVSEAEIVKAAQQRAGEITTAAQNEARTLRQTVTDYCDNMLKNTEETMVENAAQGKECARKSAPERQEKRLKTAFFTHKLHIRQKPKFLQAEMTADRDFFCCILRQKREHKPLQSGA